MTVVNCVDLGDPPVVDGVPPPVRYIGCGISNGGVAAGAIVKQYPNGPRTVTVCLITPGETFTFKSPFGFTPLFNLSQAVLGSDKVVYGAVNQDGDAKVLVGDSNTRAVTQMPDFGKRQVHATWVRDQSIYGIYAAISNADPDSGTFVIQNRTIRRIRVAGYHAIMLNAISPNEKHQYFLAYLDSRPGQPVYIIVSKGEGTILPINPDLTIYTIGDSGVAVALKKSDPNVVVFKSRSDEREFNIAQLLGRGAKPDLKLFMNSSDVLAGGYWAQSKPGIYLIVEGHVVDLMSQPSIAQYGFSNLIVSGFNDSNQILLEGEIAGQAGSRLYRCDVDLHA